MTETDDHGGARTAAGKRALRDRMRAALASVSAASRQTASAALARHFQAAAPALLEAARRVDGRHVARGEAAPARIMSFVGVRHEIDTGALNLVVLERWGALWLPRIIAPGRMRVHEVTDLGTLRAGPHGLREPPDDGTAGAAVETLDLILAPGLAFGADGARLGHGGGFYDRFWGGERGGPLRVGVGFASQRVDVGDVPAAAHDVPVDALLTDAGLALCSARIKTLWTG